MTVVASKISCHAPAATSGQTLERHFVRRGHGAEFEMEAAWIRDNLPPAARRVVDLGCGGGALFPTIGFHRAIGADVSALGLMYTRRRFAETPLVCASADRLPFAPGSLDGITLQHVIEHLPAAESACGEWFRALRPGGTLLVLTPHADFVDPTVYDDPTHRTIFDRHALIRLVSSVGFELVDVRTLGLPWFRNYGAIPGGWRLRRWVTWCAKALSGVPGLRWRGQTLCCVARRPNN